MEWLHEDGKVRTIAVFRLFHRFLLSLLNLSDTISHAGQMVDKGASTANKYADS